MFSEVVESLVEMTDTELHEHLCDLELRRRRLDAELAATIAVADARQVNQLDAHRSMKGYLKATCNWSNAEVTRWRCAATAVNAHAEIGEAWMSGHIGTPQVAVFAKTHANRRVRDELGPFVPTLLEHAEELPYDDFTQAVAHFESRVDDDGAHDARDDAIEHRRAAVVSNGGSLDINVFGGDGVTTDEVVEIHRAFCDAEFRHDLATRRDLHGADAEQHDLPRTAAQRSYDAIVEIYRRAAGSDASGVSADRVVNIVIDAGTFARMQADSGLAPTSVDGQPVDPFTGLAAAHELLDELVADTDGLTDVRCETEAGTPVHPHDVLRATLAGHVRRVVVDSAGHVIDFGRKQRLYSGAAREAAKLLIRRCEHPGCDLPAGWSDVDHNTEWADHGRTDQANAGVLCARHNRAKHRHRWRRRTASNGHRYTVRADGTVMLPIGARPPRFIDDEPDPADPEPWVDHDDPDEIQRLTHLARLRLHAAIDNTNPPPPTT